MRAIESWHGAATALAAVCCCLFGASGLSAQVPPNTSAASSDKFFAESATTTAYGGKAQSTFFALDATFGEPFLPSPATSKNYALSAGFIGTLAGRNKQPWLTEASPKIVEPFSNKLVWLSGTRLNLGNNPSVLIGGKSATVIAKSATAVAVRPPSLSPGWHPVTLANASGTTTLSRGIGVLPMLYTEGAPASGVAFDLVFRGTKGDLVFWAIGINSGPAVPIPGFLHGLSIVTTPVFLVSALGIQQADGEARLSFPAVPYSTSIFIQALFKTSNLSYAPGSFSNMLSL